MCVDSLGRPAPRDGQREDGDLMEARRAGRCLGSRTTETLMLKGPGEGQFISQRRKAVSLLMSN